jgi:hypothetical protein
MKKRIITEHFIEKLTYDAYVLLVFQLSSRNQMQAANQQKRNPVSFHHELQKRVETGKILTIKKTTR